MTSSVEQLCFTYEGHRRTASIVVPHLVEKKCRPLPLLMVFHGMGATGAMAVADYGLHELADRERVVVVAPDALPVWPDKKISFRSNPRLWRTRPLDQGEPVDESEFALALIDTVDLHVPTNIDRSRLYACGFSNGGQVVWKLVVERADMLSAAGIVCSTHSPLPLVPQPPTPIIWILGGCDPFCPTDGGVITPPWGGEHTAVPVPVVRNTWLDAIGLPREPMKTEFEGLCMREHYCDHDPFRRLLQITVTGMGHHWPGSPARLPERVAGPASDPFIGSNEIWQFCKQYCRTPG